MEDREEVVRGTPQGPHEPVRDGARHPAEPNLVVLAFEDVNLGEGHFDLLSCGQSRSTAELLMAFRRPPLPAGFMKRTCSMYTHVIAGARQRPDADERQRLHACTCCRCRSEEHTSELQSQSNLVCRLLLEKK